MSDTQQLRIEPTAPVGGVRPVQPAGVERATPDVRPEVRAVDSTRSAAAIATTGDLPAAYAQFVVDPDTQEVVVKIKDVATDRVVTELPSPAVQAMDKSLREYAEFLARHRAMAEASKSHTPAA